MSDRLQAVNTLQVSATLTPSRDFQAICPFIHIMLSFFYRERASFQRQT